MKKSLFALAVAGAFAGVATQAQAQSSVTVYGLIDAGVGSSAITYGTGANSKIQQNFVGGISSANGTGQEAGSRLGFRGVEDIGGGTRVGFTMEIGINYSNGVSTTAAPDVTTSALGNTTFFNNTRQAFASLGNNSFGELRIGTQDSLAKNLLGAYDPTKEANTTGATSLYQQGQVTRFGQAATYQAPAFVKGLTLRAQYANDGTNYGNVSTTNTPTTNNAWSLSAKYDAGNFSIGTVYESRLSYYVAAGTANSATALLPNMTTAGIIPSVNMFGLAASYDLGVVKPMLSYYGQKWNNPNNYSTTGTVNGYQMGFSAPVTPVIELVGSYITGKITNAGSDLYNTSGLQAQVNYALSKRSRLYGIYGQTNWASQRTATTADVKVQQYGVGLLHTF